MNRIEALRGGVKQVENLLIVGQNPSYSREKYLFYLSQYLSTTKAYFPV